ncbi:hypothetical protein P152DRAFT_71221 [Eremomyces bilateralis CBS 781.70]|uniref:Uncharacterized protein n=1 Tax=Eremomyces bilateralis CBS 781.70 TaxID=1392243 RepID=A0A6G1FZU1_9PEZI|nr:uncharacterized protein P152DRAFT_71221 [Eremomyces bilateralis CBS 781.70]KAF1811375.1 hypothetical protein P152DRAFT_71221 [Eremomyces bilateralis CBS 781.70]
MLKVLGSGSATIAAVVEDKTVHEEVLGHHHADAKASTHTFLPHVKDSATVAETIVRHPHLIGSEIGPIHVTAFDENNQSRGLHRACLSLAPENPLHHRHRGGGTGESEAAPDIAPLIATDHPPLLEDRAHVLPEDAAIVPIHPAEAHHHDLESIDDGTYLPLRVYLFRGLARGVHHANAAQDHSPEHPLTYLVQVTEMHVLIFAKVETEIDHGSRGEVPLPVPLLLAKVALQAPPGINCRDDTEIEVTAGAHAEETGSEIANDNARWNTMSHATRDDETHHRRNRKIEDISATSVTLAVVLKRLVTNRLEDAVARHIV